MKEIAVLEDNVDNSLFRPKIILIIDYAFLGKANTCCQKVLS